MLFSAAHDAVSAVRIAGWQFASERCRRHLLRWNSSMSRGRWGFGMSSIRIGAMRGGVLSNDSRIT
jgi:hypothetical protein